MTRFNPLASSTDSPSLSKRLALLTAATSAVKTEQNTEYHELTPYKYKDQHPLHPQHLPPPSYPGALYASLGDPMHQAQPQGGEAMTGGYLEPLQAAPTSSSASASSQMSPQQTSAGLMNGRGLLSGLNMPLDPSDPFLRDPTVRYPVPITDVNGNADVHPSSGSHSLTTLGRPTTTYSDLSGSTSNRNSSSSNSNNNGGGGGGANSNQSNSDGELKVLLF